MIGKLSREARAMRQAELWDRSTPLVVQAKPMPAPHIHERERRQRAANRARRTYGIPVKAHPLPFSIYVPPPGLLAWSLLARVVAPK